MALILIYAWKGTEWVKVQVTTDGKLKVKGA